MRSNLRKHSIPSFHSQVLSSTGSPAVIRHDEVDGKHPPRHASSPAVATPLHLIYNEALSSLISELAELRLRCDSLEEADSELREEVRAVKEVQSTMTTQSMPQTAQLPEAYGSLNLTRYASSEESTSSNCAASGRPTPASKKEFADFKIFVDKKFDSMTQILERFQSDLNAEGVARYKLGQELERTKHDATKTKGRVGALEMMGERVHEKADELALSVAEQNHSRPAVPSNPVRGGSDLTVTQSQLQDALAEIGDLTLEIGQHETAINGLVARLDEKKASSNNETTDLTAADYASRMNKDVMDRGRKMPEATVMRRALEAIMRKTEMQQKVDDIISKDNLHFAYAQLKRCIGSHSSSDAGEEILKADIYEGTYDELFSLRDRVVRRLITIDQYEEALQEAEKAAVYI